jgi:hypothetical protein
MSADSSASTEKPKMHHQHHKGAMASRKDTDNDADKLNACMADATPTASQEQCLKAASGQS